MKELLLAISFLSIGLGEVKESVTKNQIQNQWLGFEPVSSEQIMTTEKRLNIILPEDYKDFLHITNGFVAPNSVEPSFMKVEEIDYLKNIDKFAIEAYNLPEIENSILIAGKDEEQYFLLIPPKNKNEKWRYWKFANWMAGEQEFANLETYLKDVLKFSETQYKLKNE